MKINNSNKKELANSKIISILIYPTALYKLDSQNKFAT